MRRTIIAIAAMLTAIKVAKEVKIFFSAGRSVENYLFWKQIAHTERDLARVGPDLKEQILDGPLRTSPGHGRFERGINCD